MVIKMNKVTFPIDFVITWVDQNDPKWQQKFNKFGLSRDAEEVDWNIRYRDYGTLKYLFRSIEKYAPWVNHIFLVTDHQIPTWLNLENKKVSIVDHTQIIPSKYLPTFNSNVIEFHFSNIPNLSEHFVLFNDDTFLNSNVKPTDFFTSTGQIRDNLALNTLMASDQPGLSFDHSYVNNFQIVNRVFNKKEVIKKNWRKIFTWKNGYWTIISFLLLPFPRFSRLMDPHVPLSYHKSMIIRLLDDYPIISNMFINRTRKTTDYSVWIARYFELLSGNFIPRSINFFRRYDLREIDKIVSDINEKKHPLICVNDADITDREFVDAIDNLRKTFSVVFSKKSEFEN